MKTKKYENGGKTKKTNTTTSGIPGVGRPKSTRHGAPDKMKPIGPKRINNDEGMKSMVSAPKGPQRSTASIPVPAKKKRRLLRRK